MSDVYESLVELKAAYDAGEISNPVRIERDEVCVLGVYSSDPDADIRVWVGAGESIEEVKALLKEALELLNIPVEIC